MTSQTPHASKGNMPLAGRRVVITRAAAQSSRLLAQLIELGAEAIAIPTIEIAPPSSWAALDRALDALASYDGVIFTSANGVEAFFGRAGARELQPSLGSSQWLCAIGPATAGALIQRGWSPGIVPDDYIAESVVEALKARPLEGTRILLPRAAVARDILPRELRRRGARVEVVEAYRTVVPESSRGLAAQWFPPGRRLVDAVLFTSSSTAENFARLLGDDYSERLAGIALAAIGPVTAETVRKLGLDLAFQAQEYTTEGLVSALQQHFAAS